MELSKEDRTRTRRWTGPDGAAYRVWLGEMSAQEAQGFLTIEVHRQPTRPRVLALGFFTEAGQCAFAFAAPDGVASVWDPQDEELCALYHLRRSRALGMADGWWRARSALCSGG
jgi:hypothetical protein